MDYAAVVSKCKSVLDVKRVQSLLKQQGLEKCTFPGNFLVKLYGRFGSVNEAASMFDGLINKTVFSWNILLTAYAQNGHLEQAKRKFDEMPQHSSVSCNVMISAYGQQNKMKEAGTLFDAMTERTLYSWNSLASAYALNRHLQQMVRLFEIMPHRNLISFNTMISAAGSSGRVDDAQALFHGMPERDLISWNAIVTAFAQNGYVQEARNAFDRMAGRDLWSWSTLISAYVQAGHVQQARILLEGVPEACVVSESLVISAYAQNGQGKEALELFRSMDLNGVALDSIAVACVLDGCENIRDTRAVHAAVLEAGYCNSCLVATALLAAYARCKSTEDAKQVFDCMKFRDLIAWTSMISAYAQNGHSRKAMDLFRVMDLHGLQPDEVAYLCLIDACADLADIKQADIVNACIVDSGFSSSQNVVLGSALINMYGKCASLEKAKGIFDAMPEEDAVSWNSLIAIYAQNGYGREAGELLYRMNLQGVQPDSTTFTILLSTCSHAGLIEEGRSHFISLGQDYNCDKSAEHYRCMVDLLGRLGQPGDAEELTNSMPYVPDFTAWSTLMGASSMHRDKERGLRAAENALQLDSGKYRPFHVAVQHFINC